MKRQIYEMTNALQQDYPSRTGSGRDWHLSRLVCFFSVAAVTEDNQMSCVAVSDTQVEIHAALK